MTSDPTDDTTSPAAKEPHDTEVKGEPVQAVQFEHSSQQTDPHHIEETGNFGETQNEPPKSRKSWAEVQQEADAREREEVRLAALHSHILRHRHHAGRSDKASRLAGVMRGTGGQWRAAIRHLPSGIKDSNGHLGTFPTEAQAAMAFDLMALACYGTDATTNHPPARYDRVLTETTKRILISAFAADDRTGRKQAREALAFLVRQVDQRGKATSQ